MRVSNLKLPWRSANIVFPSICLQFQLLIQRYITNARYSLNSPRTTSVISTGYESFSRLRFTWKCERIFATVYDWLMRYFKTKISEVDFYEIYALWYIKFKISSYKELEKCWYRAVHEGLNIILQRRLSKITCLYIFHVFVCLGYLRSNDRFTF